MSDIIFEPGDIVECINSSEFRCRSFLAGERAKILGSRYTGYGSQIRLKPKNSSANWYRAKNFKLVEKAKANLMKNPTPTIFLVMKLIETDSDGTYDLDSLNAFRYNSEAEAKEAIRNELEKIPDAIFGIFPLGCIAKIEKPPVVFRKVSG